VYPNFPEPGLEGFARAYWAGNVDRLSEVRARYDPDDVFRGPQSIPLSAGAPARIG